jgi:hypothetical protein
MSLPIIDCQLVLKGAWLPEEVPPVGNARSTAFDGLAEDGRRCLRYVPPIIGGKAARLPQGVDRSPVEDLAGIDIPDPGDNPLIHEKGLYREASLSGDFAQTVGFHTMEGVRHGRCIARGSIPKSECRKAPRIYADELILLEGQGEAGVRQRREAAVLQEKSARHAQMEAEALAACEDDFQALSPAGHRENLFPRHRLDPSQPEIVKG